MSRLTKDLRSSIASNAVNATFKPRQEELKKEEIALAIECYNSLFPEKVRRAVARVPKEWIRTCSCLQFNANGWRISLNAGKEMPTPAMSGCGNLGSITGELGEKVQTFSQKGKTLNEEWRTALRKMEGFLEQFGSFKKLEEAWPEGKKFYEKYNAERPSTNVPAVITKEINDMLGIKVK